VTVADDRPERIEAVLTSPLGVLAAITAAQRLGENPTVPLRGAVLEEWVVECCADLDPHRPEHGEIVRELTSAAGELRPTVEWLLATEATDDWFVPLDRGVQIWASADGARPDPARFRADAWRLAQPRPPGPLGGPWTATAGHDADEPAWLRVRERRTPTGEPAAGGLWHLVVADEARVFEVDGPLAWRWLCRRYPDTVGRGEVLPDWAAVAADWDGIHVSVGGLVTAHGVAVGSANSWSTVRGWGAEGTLWLRWAFASMAALSDLASQPERTV
jgi:hypothetical protein